MNREELTRRKRIARFGRFCDLPTDRIMADFDRIVDKIDAYCKPGIGRRMTDRLTLRIWFGERTFDVDFACSPPVFCQVTDELHGDLVIETNRPITEDDFDDILGEFCQRD